MSPPAWVEHLPLPSNLLMETGQLPVCFLIKGEAFQEGIVFFMFLKNNLTFYFKIIVKSIEEWQG